MQNFALQTVLNRMGHDSYTLPASVRPKWMMPAVYAKRLFFRYILRKPTDIRLERVQRAISVYTRNFIRNHIRLWEGTDLADFDAFVVGSDQIWRPDYFPDCSWAFLDFVADRSDIRRIAYAPSFGTEKWPFDSRQTRVCGELLKKFSAVSVREDTAVTLCGSKWGIHAVQVLDPTLLLDKEIYDALTTVADCPVHEGELLVYMLDPSEEKSRILSRLSEETGFSSFPVSVHYDDPCIPLQERIVPPVEQWLRGFRDAGGVFTDSFHACAFSILYNKPFVAYGNEERGMSRFRSLLGLFGLERRLVSSPQEAVDIWKEPIDWKTVNTLLNEQRERSLRFLNDALK